MQEIIENIMYKTGYVQHEIECKFGQIEYTSRGFYICAKGGRWYLHHDGLAKDGVIADSEKPAFWPSEKEAQDFFDAWKRKKYKKHNQEPA